MQCPPIVSFEEMRAMEKKAFAEGVSFKIVMEEVASGIAGWIEAFITKEALPKTLCVFAGKGNKGSDSLWSALYLIKKGFAVSIVLPFSPSLLNPKSTDLLKDLQSANASIISLQEAARGSFSIILDGLLGTGVKGDVKEPVLSAINTINTLQSHAASSTIASSMAVNSTLPGVRVSVVVSIDVPSGLCDGFREGAVAVNADYTLYISLPKRCAFEAACWEKVGELVEIPTPSFAPFYEMKQAKDFLIQKECLMHTLHEKRNLNKYEAGYLLLIAGSKEMRGAAKLTAEAAYRSGCGIIRLFGSAVDLPEVITEERNVKRFSEELKRATCVAMGPGLGKNEDTKTFFTECLQLCRKTPLILDADALILLKDTKLSLPESAILTPHYGELLHLLGMDKAQSQEEVFAAARSYAMKHKIILICKGSPTRIFSEEGSCWISPIGDPAMATAGMGDVLTGVLAALLSRGLTPLEAAQVGVYLHAEASLQSLKRLGLFHLLASDCIEELSKTISKFFHRN